MPEWLAILIAVLGGLSTATGLFAIWLRPLFKLRKDVDDNKKEIEVLKAHQDKDYKARLRSEQLQKAQVKALIALLNSQISGHDVEKLKRVRDELQVELTELI